ncbi:unnamed protein product, partial [Didymodactylos carnosus]
MPLRCVTKIAPPHALNVSKAKNDEYESTSNSGKHYEYLPYPDLNFNDDNGVDLIHTIDGQFTLSHVYEYDGKTFVPKIHLSVKSVEAKCIQDIFSKLLKSYTYIVTVQYGSYEWVVVKDYEDFYQLHQRLLKFAEIESTQSIDSLN